MEAAVEEEDDRSAVRRRISTERITIRINNEVPLLRTTTTDRSTITNHPHPSRPLRSTNPSNIVDYRFLHFLSSFLFLSLSLALWIVWAVCTSIECILQSIIDYTLAPPRGGRIATESAPARNIATFLDFPRLLDPLYHRGSLLRREEGE